MKNNETMKIKDADSLKKIQAFLKNAVLMMKDLNKAKSLTYKNALEKQTAIIKALREEQDADKERVELLEATNKMLTQIINDLKYDLDMES